MYTVPWGFLSAVLLVFGRLSSNQEITAFRVAGVSLVRLSAPVFIIGALLSLGSLWLNVNVVPVSKATIAQLLYEQASRDPDSLLKPGVVQGNFKGDGEDMQKVLVEAKSGEWVEGFHLYQIPGSGSDDQTYVHARRAALAVDGVKSQLRVKLEDAYFETRKPDGRVEMAFAGRAEPLLIDLKNPRNRKTRPSAMTNSEIRAEVAANTGLPPAKKVRFRSEITKRYSFSMACLAFAFIAVPLGIGARRRDTSSGLVVSLLIGTGYFLLTMLSEQFKTDAGATAMLWAPNAACVLLGIVLFRRARFR
jgi:lipopolysaccharide export system permease protein